MDYTELISILYYLSFSVFVVSINEIFIYCSEEGVKSLLSSLVNGLVSVIRYYFNHTAGNAGKMVMLDGCSDN